MKNQPMKILVTGGGTGGHVFPLMSVVSELKKQKTKIIYVGSGNLLERVQARKYNISYKKIFSGKWRRYFDLNNFIDIFKIIIGFLQSILIILFFWPDAIFSKGGYVGLPIVYAAWILRRPIFIHESDSVLGLANKLSIKKCKKIFVGFPAKYHHNLPIDKVVYTGNPMSENYNNLRIKKYFKNNKPTIFVTGGSQGARFINQTIAKVLPVLTKKYNIIHLAGNLDYEWLKKNSWKDYLLYSFTDDFASMLYNSDLIISRSGSTIFEIAYCAKPSILIPLPSSANNHQEVNARILEQENAAIVLREKNLTSESLLEIIERIMEDKNLREELAGKINQFFQKDASRIIAEEIIKEINNKK